jgi:hypothetical protein
MLSMFPRRLVGRLRSKTLLRSPPFKNFLPTKQSV